MPTMWLKCLIILWWLCSTSFHVQIRHIYQDNTRSGNWAIFCKYLRFLEMTMLQCLAGAITTAVLLKLAKKKPLVLPAMNKKVFALVFIGHITGSLAINAGISMHSIYIQHLFRSFEPMLVFILLTHSGHNIRNSIYVFLGLGFMSTGMYIFRWKQDLMVTQWSILAAVIPVFMFPLRNVYLKSYGDTWKDPVQKYLVISTFGFLVLLPVALIKLAYTRILPSFSAVTAWQSIAFNVIDNLISIFLLELFSPIFHSVLGTFVQYSIAIMIVMYFHVSISWRMSVGMGLFLVGFVFYYQKYTNSHELRRFKMICILTLYLMFGANLLWNVKLDTTAGLKQPTSMDIHTFWVYNKPPGKHLLLNMQRVYLDETSMNNLHVFCGTFSCVKQVKDLNDPKISTTFLTFNDFAHNTPLEGWFKPHSLHKIFSGNNFENHLHEATRLALLWRYGGTFSDPFLGNHGTSFRELQNHHSWVAKFTNDNSSGILTTCRFKKRHPFVKTLAEIFVKLYYQLCYLKQSQSCEKVLIRFDVHSSKALVDFCTKNIRSCPQTVELAAQRIDKEIYKKYFDIAFMGIQTAGIQNLAFMQFIPFVERFTTTSGYHASSKFGKALGSIILAEILGPKEVYSLEYLAYLGEKEPVGCLYTRTMNILRSHGIEAFLSGGISLLMKSPLGSLTARKDMYIVDLNQSVIKKLPMKIQDLGLHLSFGKKNEPSQHSWFRSIHGLLKKIATAKLVVTGDVHCASAAVSFDTPVVFVKTTEANITQDLVQVFHTWDPKIDSLNSTVVLISKLLSGEVPVVSNLGLFMRLRATMWSAIRRFSTVLESGLRFGVVPFTRPRSNTAENAVFHLIFTTSEKSTISLEEKSGNVKGGFVWRHWRCIESIFYHHPLATVVIHSNTLLSRSFDVLRESGYNIQVKPYSLAELARGTPAEVFVRDELPYAREGQHWYSHETDLLRLLILFKFGGIYMDIDMIVVRELHTLPLNVIGWESTYNMNGAFLKFQKGHPYLHACIRQFSERYSQAWSDNGPLLLTRVWRQWSTTNPENDVTTVARTAFYMFFYRSIEGQCFEETSGAIFNMNWNTLQSQAYAVHLYSKVTAGYGGIKEGTLCKYILNTFCVLCIKVY